MANVFIPTPLRGFTGGAAQFETDAGTAGEALQQLVSQYPELRNHLYTEDGQLRSFVNFYLGDDNLRDLQGVETPLEQNAELNIIPAIAGGC